MTRKDHNGNGHKHVTETPDVSHIRNIDVTHETSDVSVSALLKFVAALTIMTVAVYLLMWGLFRYFNARAEQEPPPGPMALTKEERLPPEPRLQSAKGFGLKLENGQWVNLELSMPQAEYRVLRGQWERQLNCQAEEKSASGHGVIAESRNSPQTEEKHETPPCVPIDTAIQQFLEQGAPARPTSAGNVAMPTAASSGRVNQRVK